MVRITDLSCTLKNFSMDPSDARITRLNHVESRRRLAKSLGRPPEQVFPFGATEDVVARTHAGTHIDAPIHFGPMSGGQPARTIDETPLEWCYGNGVFLDFSRSKAFGAAITTEDLKTELRRIEHTLKPLDIVLIRTGAEDHEDDPRFEEMASGLVRESLMWLLDQGVMMIATDAYTLDIPIPRMFELVKKGDKDAFFPVHYAGREREYSHGEKFFNLKSLPAPTGFRVAMFPTKIEGATGGWTRAVAIEGEGPLTRMPALVDLSAPIMSQSVDWAEVSIFHVTAEEQARRFAKRFGAAISLLPTPDLWASDEVTCSSHAGTHVNAPWHYAPTVEGRPARTIDQVPLEWCYGDGVLLDFSRKAHGRITAADLRGELDRLAYTLKPGDIVLIRTGAEDHPLDAPDLDRATAGLTGEAFAWLFERGIRTTGTDAFVTDLSMERVSRKLDSPAAGAAVFPLHAGALTRDSCHAERLYNLKTLPRPFGFKVAMFPVKLEGSSAAWARAVAIL